MDTIRHTHSFLKQSISLSDFGLRPGAHIPFCLLLYGVTSVCFLAHVLPQDILINLSLWQANMSTEHYNSSLYAVIQTG